MALVPSKDRVYAWGLGGAGQLGNRASRSATTPQVVLGPWSSTNGSSMKLDLYSSPQIDCIVRHIFSGADHCFATITPREVCVFSSSHLYFLLIYSFQTFKFKLAIFYFLVLIKKEKNGTRDKIFNLASFL